VLDPVFAGESKAVFSKELYTMFKYAAFTHSKEIKALKPVSGKIKRRETTEELITRMKTQLSNSRM
jgi:hypothetical protein